ncbi:nuclear protein 96-domain-containing protein [Microdochium trichocladiopsis]|uniref:Nuclear protein 96-domain-containing protein n=1 Tax=Microdochium trichocladiopsis TaxID=1682393 RepID=A0A9P9BNJ5_9PEZI|nr:nuclear protein 96-domain-containing protein [Microdochium trichocladiopsis]KAH7020923.1 nuclear protein 96-domain-containing protein [Microdochium trichocladiopsis]
MSFGGFGSGGGFGSNTNTTSGGFGGFGGNTTNNTTSGFGANNSGGFGTSGTTGGGLFGGGGTGTTSGFGSNTGAFGSTASSGFGAKPAFGSTPATSAGGGLFGSSTTATTGGGFGGFGSNNATNTTSSFGGGTSGGLFGGSSAAKPAFGATTGTTGGGLFGSGTGTSTTGGFGGFGSTNNAPASTALGAVGDPPGTAAITNFQPFVEKDSATSSAQNSFQNILFVDPYKKWSAEELRLVDYAQNRRYGGTGGGGAFGSTTFGGGFGATAQQPAATSGFGTTNTTSTGGGLFGSTPAASSGGLFGQSNTGTTGTTGGFGASSGTGGLFGSKPAATTGGLFGGGTTATQSQPSGGLFGSNPGTSFGSTNTATGGFGATNTTGGGLFGGGATQQPKPGGLFGASTTTPATGGFGSGGFGTTTTGAANTGGGLFGAQNNAATGQTGGGLFGSAQNNQQQSAGTGFGGFGAQPQQQSGGLFGSSTPQAKPGGLFGSGTATTGTTGGGLFGGGASTTTTGGFGQPAQGQSGGLFGNKPATGGGLFGSSTTTNNTGGGLFGGMNQTTQNQGQSGGLFGNQNKPATGGGLFGNSTPATGGGLFGASTNNQQSGGLFGNSTNQQQQSNSLFGGSMGNQSTPTALTASVNDPSAYGTSLFGNIGNNEVTNPGPLATPIGKRQAKRPSILPMYKLNPSSASRYATPQRKGNGFGFSYSTYGTPGSPSSVASTPGAMSQSLLGGGSLTRSLAKSISSNSLRRSFNVEDTLLAPGAFSASSGSRLYGSNSVKKLVINRELRSDLFSTPTKDKPLQETPNGSRKLNKRVSFESNTIEAIENGEEAATPQASNGTNGVSPISSSQPETEQVKGNELAIVEEEPQSPAVNASIETGDGEPGQYWMSPSKEEIQNMNRVQRQRVANFTVGRDNVGYVKFKVPVDLTSINLDELFDNIVILVPRTATVYPNPAKKPPVGKGLNVPSLISLENAYPRKSRGKTTSVKKHIERLKRIENTTFESYVEETGQWTFSVEHFTTYGLDDSDEEDETTEQEPVAAPPRASQWNSFAASSDAGSAEDEELYEFRRSQSQIPGAFDSNLAYESDEQEEMAERKQSKPSFLAERSVGSASKALVLRDEEDVEYATFEASEDASASLEQHQAMEQDDSFAAEVQDMVQETPAGIMRARMRAIRDTSTPVKIQVAAGDDWQDMLTKSVSPQKRDRALLKSIHENDRYRAVAESSKTDLFHKKRVVSDGRGFATSIDLMNSLFDKAKAPVQAPQAPHRPQGVKWPYKRVTKTMTKSDMNASERQWRDTMRPNWGPSGALVFAATPDHSAFKRSGRITEKNGLMTVTKNGIVTESQDIRIAKFTNEMSARSLALHQRLSKVVLVDGIPSVHLDRATKLKDFAVGGDGGKNTAADHERLVWELASVLFDAAKIPADLHNHPAAAEILRRDELSRFWEGMVESQTSKAVAMAASSEEKALAALSGHKKAEACKHLLEGKNFRLATLVALIGTSDDVKRDMRDQIREWQDAHVLVEFSQPIRALYEMLSGNVCACEGVKGAVENRSEPFVISRRFGLNWQQAFGLRLWYAISSNGLIADAVKRFRDDIAQEKEDAPVSWYLESGIAGIWNDPDVKSRQDLLWGLLQLYSDERCDLEAVLQPENSQLSPLDYRLSWQLGQALVSSGQVSFGADADEKADAMTIAFASQLTNEGHWLEATFVLLHLSDPLARSRAVQEQLCRHAGHIGGEDSSSFKKLVEDYKIPTQWVWHAKALFMRSVKKDPTGEVQCLLRAESFADAHRTFVKEVAPVTIIQRDYDALADVLRQFEGRHARVPEWNIGGEVYKLFLELMGYQRRHEQPPSELVSALLEGLPAMHGNSPEAGITEYAALTDMAAEVAKVVAGMAKIGQVSLISPHERFPSCGVCFEVAKLLTRVFSYTDGARENSPPPAYRGCLAATLARPGVVALHEHHGWTLRAIQMGAREI